ncbi:MAG TPA: FG-GAP-like repeat-containing protein, partial [Ferruginibacter sp.]|nr:FG-GAP-like repeat-containing protein [Ferruginibacter sp.]
ITTANGAATATGFNIPSVTSFSPATGVPGTSISITGLNLGNVTGVSLGGTPAASFAIQNLNNITAVVGQGTSGDINVITPYGSSAKLGFTYIPPVSIISFSPVAASTGSTVTITGSGFIGTTAVSFGGIAAANFTIVSANTITAVVANGASGNISVTKPLSTGILAGFTYLPPPFITSFTPVNAATGSTVTISGSNFTGTTSVSFGGTAVASFIVNSATTITAVVSNGSSGSVMVITPNGTSSKTGFIFYPPPVITSFYPTTGGIGTIVTITGTDLNITSLSVTFGGVTAFASQVLPNSLRVVIGSGATGNVLVTHAGGSATLPGFVFLPLPVINSFSPASGPAGNIVTISGFNFSNSPTNNIVYFGTSPAIVSSASVNSLSVIVPPGATYQPISVTTNGLTATSSKSFIKTFPGGVLLPTSFSERTDYSTAINPGSLAIGDLNADGKPDLVVANYNSSTISIFRNQSEIDNINLAPKIDLPAGATPHSISIKDINGDGKLDIILLNSTLSGSGENTVSIFKNTSTTGNISFNSRITFLSGYSPGELTIADMDSDGRPDLVVTNYGSSINGYENVSVFQNNSSNGAISFFDKVFYSVNYSGVSALSFIYAIAVGDFNSDNKPDIVVGNESGQYFTILKNESTPGFINLSMQQYAGYFYGDYNSIVVADFDKDGKDDILTNNIIFTNTSTIPIPYTFSGNRIPGIAGAVAIADLEGDGKPDFAKAGTSLPKASVVKNNSSIGAITFATKVDYFTGISPRSIASCDIDGDGKPEIVTANFTANSISILRNKVGEIIQVCPPIANTTITSNITGNNYQWQINTGSGYTNINNGLNYSGSNTPNLQLISIPSSSYGYKYRSIADGNNSYAFTLQFANNWTGAVNSSWENSSNWSCGTLPDSNTDVVINSGSVNINSNVTIRSLVVNTGVILTVGAGNTLAILH